MTKLSVGGVQKLIDRAQALDLIWPLPPGCDDARLTALFYPGADTASSVRRDVRCLLIHYTPVQLLDVVGHSKEVFHPWKSMLPGLPHGKSYGPSFSPRDVSASAVLWRLTDSCCVRVGQLRAVSGSIFAVCNETTWVVVLAERVLLVDLGRKECAALLDDLHRSSPVASGSTRHGTAESARASAAGGVHR